MVRRYLSVEFHTFEPKNSPQSAQTSLAEKILSDAEYARFEAAEDKRGTLLRLWVLKEAAGKLTGEGINGYPNHTDFDPQDARIQEIDGCYVAILKEDDDAF